MWRHRRGLLRPNKKAAQAKQHEWKQHTFYFGGSGGGGRLFYCRVRRSFFSVPASLWTIHTFSKSRHNFSYEITKLFCFDRIFSSLVLVFTESIAPSRRRSVAGKSKNISSIRRWQWSVKLEVTRFCWPPRLSKDELFFCTKICSWRSFCPLSRSNSKRDVFMVLFLLRRLCGLLFGLPFAFLLHAVSSKRPLPAFQDRAA